MAGSSSSARVRTVCPHDCPDACSMLATVEDGRVVAVRGDPDHPFTAGFLCAKVNRYPERVHSPERLRHFLRRTGPKGSGSWQAISWDEALDEIAARWDAIRRQHGALAILAYVYSGNMGLISRNLPRALFNLLGTTQVVTGTVCDTTAEAAWDAVYGPCSPLDPEEAERADLIVAWGADVLTSNVHLVPFIDRARERGAPLVAIAPYRTRTARRADWFIPIRPATDGALALGVAHVLFREGLADEGFLGREAIGWQEWARTVLPRYTPEAVEAITGVPAADVQRLARTLRAAQAPFIRVGPGMSRHLAGGRALQAVLVLPAILGVWGRPGAGVFLETAHAFPLNYEALRRTDRQPGPLRTVNHAQLGSALTELTDPPIQAFFVMSNNPAVTCPDAGRIRRGLLRQDLFTVVHDTFMTETAELADIVLPATTALESEDVFRSYGHLYMQYARPIIPPVGEARSNAWVVQELARRLGVQDEIFERSPAEHVQALVTDADAARRLLAGERVKFSPTGGPGRWRTPSGKIEFKPWPEFLPDTPAGEPPSYPLRLLTAPGHLMHHTSFEAASTLVRRSGAPRCLLNPEEARRRHIRSGDAVEIYNERGSVGLYAEVTGDVPAGLVVVEGQRSARAFLFGGPLNVLTSERLADMGEGATYLSTWVDVRRAG